MARSGTRPSKAVVAQMKAVDSYTVSLTKQLWAYQAAKFSREEELFDRKYSHLPNAPVFTKRDAHRNVIVPDDRSLATAVLELVPQRKQHRWFRSMKSSQALALSVFGNLKILHRADCLAHVPDEDGFGLAFRDGTIQSADLELEHDVDSLNEIRSTSVDLLVSGPTITCVECKLSEAEVGCCSRPALKEGHAEYLQSIVHPAEKPVTSLRTGRTWDDILGSHSRCADLGRYSRPFALSTRCALSAGEKPARGVRRGRACPAWPRTCAARL